MGYLILFILCVYIKLDFPSDITGGITVEHRRLLFFMEKVLNYHF